MRIYDIGFQIISISLCLLFSSLINLAYGQEANETTKIYENSDIGIRFEYPSYWGDVVQIGEESCHTESHCSVGILSSPFTGNMVLNKFSHESCVCNNLMEFVKWFYKADQMMEGFSFINDNTTTIGKNYSGWQYEYSFVNDGIDSKGRSVLFTNNDKYYSMGVIYRNELGAKRVTEFNKVIDSVELLPVIPAKIPSFMNMNGTQETKSSASIHNTILEETLRPITVGERQASLYTKITPPASTSDKKQNTLFQLRLFDSVTGNNITDVNYFINISKGNKPVMTELFYSKEGPLTLTFEPNQRVRMPLINGTTEPFLGGWTSNTGQITVSGPVFVEGGLYHFTVEIFGIDNVRNIFVPENAPRFDFNLLMNLSEPEKSQTDQATASSMLKSSPKGLRILSHNSFTDSLGYMHVVGVVNNNSPSTATFVQIIGTFYDADSQVVGTESAYADPYDLVSGQTAPFEILLLSASIPISQIDRYTLQASSD